MNISDSRRVSGCLSDSINHGKNGLCNSVVVKRIPHILKCDFSLQHSPCFLDDAEVQRQKVVPVLISDGYNFPLAHLESP